MSVEETVKWVQNVLVPRIMQHDKFEGDSIINCEVSPVEGMKDNWASRMYDINLQLRGNNGQKVVAIIAKLMDESEKVREQMHSENQFSNEVLMYSTAVPFFKSLTNSPTMETTVETLFPKCFYTHIKSAMDTSAPSPEDGIVAMENLKLLNYKLGSRTFLDLKHCNMAMKYLGSFHALSYFAKEIDYNTFKSKIANGIRESNYDPQGRNNINTVFSICEHRVLDALAQQLPSDDPGLTRLQSIAARDAFDVYTELVKPSEPLAVLCHGDFLRNNVLYRYVDGEPVDMKFIDFQTIRYASPAIDVSLFLCMNTSHALRIAHFQELLRTYHDSLSCTLAALQGKSVGQLDPRYSFDAFTEDFRTHAVYGYMISIEFIPWMMASEEELAEFVKLFREEYGSPKYLDKSRVLGGDDVTKVLVELAKDLIQFGYL